MPTFATHPLLQDVVEAKRVEFPLTAANVVGFHEFLGTRLSDSDLSHAGVERLAKLRKFQQDVLAANAGQGQRGERGPPGEKGDMGTQGPPGPSNLLQPLNDKLETMAADQQKAVEEQKKAVEEQKKAVEEQKEALENLKKEMSEGFDKIARRLSGRASSSRSRPSCLKLDLSFLKSPASHTSLLFFPLPNTYPYLVQSPLSSLPPNTYAAQSSLSSLPPNSCATPSPSCAPYLPILPRTVSIRYVS
ncbi:hypothetical protein IAT38_007238 [Cryptococcus sp. DSM 104549]